MPASSATVRNHAKLIQPSALGRVPDDTNDLRGRTLSSHKSSGQKILRQISYCLVGFETTTAEAVRRVAGKWFEHNLPRKVDLYCKCYSSEREGKATQWELFMALKGRFL